MAVSFSRWDRVRLIYPSPSVHKSELQWKGELKKGKKSELELEMKGTVVEGMSKSGFYSSTFEDPTRHLWLNRTSTWFDNPEILVERVWCIVSLSSIMNMKQRSS